MSEDLGPQPPVLIVRPSLAFWVVHGGVRQSRATLQAFREGCFDGAVCYDSSGGAWDVTGATLERPPTIVQRILLHRRIPVTLELGPRRAADLDDLVGRLREVLTSGSDFCDHLGAPAEQVLGEMEAAESAEAVIRVAARYAT